jgi:AraC-like DNA-binding protein
MRFVEEVHVLVPSRGQARHERLPDGRTTLVVRVLEGRAGDVCVSGPQSHALFKNLSGVLHAVVLQLKPGWTAQLLGVAASTLSDRFVPLEDLWGPPGRELSTALLASPQREDVLRQLSHVLVARGLRSKDSAPAHLTRRAVRLLENGELRVDRVAEQLGVTARHLRRAFADNVGVGPKEFARTVRLRRAVRLAASSTDWSRIARDAGYYDQAHLIADFRDLVGLTPGAFLARGWP